MSRIKNIIIVSDFGFVNGGNANVAIETALGLTEIRNLNVYFFTGSKKIDERIIRSRIIVKSLFQEDILNNKNRFQAFFNGLWNKIAEKSFYNEYKTLDNTETVVHLHSWSKILSASIFKSIERLGFKTIITLHDYFSFCPNGGFFNYKKNCICSKKPMSLSCLLCDCDSRKLIYKFWRVIRQTLQNNAIFHLENLSFITISELNNSIAKKYLPKSVKTFLIKNPVDIGCKNVVDISNNDYYLFMGRLSREKGVYDFCDAITSLGLKGFVLGDGDLRKNLEDKYPNIKFFGWVSGEKKESLIMKSKALVFPSVWYEGAPLTIIEMKAYGIPCIVSNASSAVEEVIDNATGLVFQAGNKVDLMRALSLYEKIDLQMMQNLILDSFDKSIYERSYYIKKVIDLYSLEN